VFRDQRAGSRCGEQLRDGLLSVRRDRDGRSRKSHRLPFQSEMRPSVFHFEQIQITASSGARIASTSAFLHLKHLGEGKASGAESEAWATTSTWNCAMAKAAPLTGLMAPELSRKWVRSVMYVLRE
jgi:hypothetical protein